MAKTTAPRLSDLEKFLEGFGKSFGTDTYTIGADFHPYETISTGSLTLDVATGVGGYVEGRLHQIWGPDDIGKRLDINTPIPTPNGWTFMHLLRVGDQVFDRWGNPCRVTFVSPIEKNPNARKVTFDNGVIILADADHQWLASTTSMRTKKVSRHGKPMDVNRVRVVTTRDMESRVKHDRPNGGYSYAKWAVPVAFPLQYEEKKLLVPPYTLGVWLGDGDTASSGITVGVSDLVHLLKQLGDDGFKCSIPPSGLKFTVARVTPLLLQPMLRELGVLGFKHIPSEYLQGSIEQRIALLQGIMDTDGSITRTGRSYVCEIGVSDKTLIMDIKELLLGLGVKVSYVGEGVGQYDGHVCKNRYRITFQASFNPFRLDRKSQQWHLPVTNRHTWRYIQSIEPCSPVPMRCIQVDSSDNSYLAGEDMVVTHNTTLALLAVAEAQRKYPNKMVAYIDMENKMDIPWADAHGVNRAQWMLYTPTNAEETSDAVGRFASSDLFSMIIVDSIGAMIGRVEQDKQADEKTVAVVAGIVTRMVKSAASQAARNQQAVILINQVRANIAPFGGSVSLPGGWALKHSTTMSFKLKNTDKPALMDRINGEEIPVARELAVVVERNKVAPKGVTAHVLMNHVPSKYGPIGVDKADEAVGVGVKLGIIPRGGAFYTEPITGSKFQGRDAIVDYYRNHPEYVEEIRGRCLAAVAEHVIVDVEPDGDPVILIEPEVTEARTARAPRRPKNA